MVFVKVSETYDLSTKVNSMGIIGIHTPSTSLITRVWDNLFKSHKFFRIAQCDITMACASMLPADPLQIGEDAGDIAPQDMFNPILYRAVSNDAFNRITGRIYNGTPLSMMDGTSGTIVRSEVENSANGVESFATYYALLAEPDGWRKAMPQSGLEMNGLYPIVYQMVNTYGQTIAPTYTNSGIQVDTPDELVGAPRADDPYGFQRIPLAHTFRGPSMRMPALPTFTPGGSGTITTTTQTSSLPQYTECPQTYVACIITPPAKLNKLYYRLKVTWTIELTGLISMLDNPVTGMTDIWTLGTHSYGTDYAEQSKIMDKKESTVDVKNADLEQVMISTR